MVSAPNGVTFHWPMPGLLEHPAGFDPATCGFVDHRSVLLSYGCVLVEPSGNEPEFPA